jgi:hypothetical protein
MLNGLYQHCRTSAEALIRLETTLDLFGWRADPTLGSFKSADGEVRELSESYPPQEAEKWSALAAQLSSVVETKYLVIRKVEATFERSPTEIN